jgi:hypothetical protein
MSAPYTDEKYPLPLTEVETPEENEQPQPRPKHTSRLRLIVLAGVLIYFVVGFGGYALKLATEDHGHKHGHGHGKESQAKCPSQPKALGKGDGWVRFYLSFDLVLRMSFRSRLLMFRSNHLNTSYRRMSLTTIPTWSSAGYLDPSEFP